MVEGKFKSRRFRRVFVRTPGGKTKIHYRQRKPSHAVCAVSGTRLSGVARASACKMSNMPKSKKRPSRPFGGVLSSRATREVLKMKARSIEQ